MSTYTNLFFIAVLLGPKPALAKHTRIIGIIRDVFALIFGAESFLDSECDYQYTFASPTVRHYNASFNRCLDYAEEHGYEHKLKAIVKKKKELDNEFDKRYEGSFNFMMWYGRPKGMCTISKRKLEHLTHRCKRIRYTNDGDELRITGKWGTGVAAGLSWDLDFQGMLKMVRENQHAMFCWRYIEWLDGNFENNMKDYLDELFSLVEIDCHNLN